MIVPKDTFLTGAVHLKSNVNLHLAEGATLRFGPEPVKYLPVVLTRFEGIECMNYSPLISAFEQENVAVTGKGTLDGSANWGPWGGGDDKSKGQPRGEGAGGKRSGARGQGGAAGGDTRGCGEAGGARCAGGTAVWRRGGGAGWRCSFGE